MHPTHGPPGGPPSGGRHLQLLLAPDGDALDVEVVTEIPSDLDEPARPDPKLVEMLGQLDLLLDGLSGPELRRTALSVHVDDTGTVRGRRLRALP